MRHASLLAPGCARPLLDDSRAVEAQDSDDYTRYELLAPETAQFRIVYEVTATTPGAAYYFNPIRKGSEASDEAVYDRASGKPLRFEVVDGAAARAAGEKSAELDTRYIKVELPRPVPAGGELRLRIDKTYRDPKSYFSGGRAHRLLALARRETQRGRAARRLRARGLQRARAGAAGAGRPDQGELHEPGARRGLGRGQGPEAAVRARLAALLLSPARVRPPPVPGPERARRAARGARTPGPRDRLLPEAARDARLRALPRRHRDRGGRPLPERRARGQHGPGPEGRRARHGRGAAGRDAQGRGDPQGRASTSASRCAPRARWS